MEFGNLGPSTSNTAQDKKPSPIAVIPKLGAIREKDFAALLYQLELLKSESLPRLSGSASSALEKTSALNLHASIERDSFMPAGLAPWILTEKKAKMDLALLGFFDIPKSISTSDELLGYLDSKLGALKESASDFFFFSRAVMNHLERFSFLAPETVLLNSRLSGDGNLLVPPNPKTNSGEDATKEFFKDLAKLDKFVSSIKLAQEKQALDSAPQKLKLLEKEFSPRLSELVSEMRKIAIFIEEPGISFYLSSAERKGATISSSTAHEAIVSVLARFFNPPGPNAGWGNFKAELESKTTVLGITAAHFTIWSAAPFDFVDGRNPLSCSSDIRELGKTLSEKIAALQARVRSEILNAGSKSANSASAPAAGSETVH